jgi:hypothetical protein
MQMPNPQEQITIDAICDLFASANISPERGEELLLWLAGLSYGMRGKRLTDDFVIPLTLAHQAAIEGKIP